MKKFTIERNDDKNIRYSNNVPPAWIKVEKSHKTTKQSKYIQMFLSLSIFVLYFVILLSTPLGQVGTDGSNENEIGPMLILSAIPMGWFIIIAITSREFRYRWSIDVHVDGHINYYDIENKLTKLFDRDVGNDVYKLLKRSGITRESCVVINKLYENIDNFSKVDFDEVQSTKAYKLTKNM